MSPRVKFLGAAIVALFLVFTSCVSAPDRAQALGWSQSNTDGFGDATNWGDIQLFVYQNKIYAGIANNTSGGEIWRSADGVNWEGIMEGGFGDASDYLVGSFASFDGYLYAATSKALPVPGGGAEIWRSPTGDQGTWTQVNTPGFGDPFNVWIDGNNLTEFNGYLYAGTGLNLIGGAEVWRSPTGELGTWTQANSDGFGSNTNTTIRTMKVYNGYLYAGVGSAPGSGSKIYRTSDGTTWEAVNDNGFGSGLNAEVIMLEEFNGNLYAGTLNLTGFQLWRSSTGNTGTWSPAMQGGFGDAHNTWSATQAAVVNGTFWLGTRNDTDGAQLWYTTDGNTWTHEGADGFGDANNYALYAVSFKDEIYIAFSNATTGAEIWRSSGIPSLSLTTDSLPDGTVGGSYSATLSASSGTSPFTYSLSSGSLPDGLNLGSDGVISGTPTREGSFSFNILITDSGSPAQTVTRSYTININSTLNASTLPETGGGQTNLKHLGWLALPILGTFSLLPSRKRGLAK